jgi:hypothetical protein
MEEEKKYNVDVSDPNVKAVLDEGKAAMNELKTNVETMTTDAKTAYESAKTELDTLAKEQAANQEEATGIAVKKLETEKENAKKDYVKEQSGAYADYQLQTQKHGANAEQMASMGMGGTGYSESAKVSMYNAYQNRVAVAREAFTRASAEYDVAIEEAKLQGSVALAEIAMKAYKEKTTLALEQMQYGNSLLNTLMEQKASISKDYWQRYLDVMSSSRSGRGPLTLKGFLGQLEGEDQEDEVVVPPQDGGGGGGHGTTYDKNNIVNLLNALGITKNHTEAFLQLIKNGVIEEYEENGKYKYRLTANGEKAYKKKLTSQENRSKDGKRK